jgi:SpoVK/Ycf46/Vps4 family AAA+-type ATPase
MTTLQPSPADGQVGVQNLDDAVNPKHGIDTTSFSLPEKALLNKLLLTIPEGMTLDKIRGQDKAVKQAKILQEQIKNPGGVKKWGITSVSNFLFIGPAGTGKSSLAGAIAAEVNIPMLQADSSMIFDSPLGSSEKNIRAIFDLAEKVAKHHASGRCLIFLDEINSLVPKRGGDNHEVTNAVTDIILQKTEPVKGNSAGSPFIVIGATNMKY